MQKVQITFTSKDAEELASLTQFIHGCNGFSYVDIATSDIVYSSDNGGDYTESSIKEEIGLWMTKTEPFKSMDDREKSQALDVIYPTLLGQLTWQCPATLLAEYDEDDIQEILAQLGAFGQEVWTKDQVIMYFAAKGYDRGDLEGDKNFFWEVVREFFGYDEKKDTFSPININEEKVNSNE
ncbi:hypothetical protein [Paenibacillus taichungensis]